MSIAKNFNDGIRKDASWLLDWAESNNVDKEVTDKLGDILDYCDCLDRCLDESVLKKDLISFLISRS